jgi:hypothetical protein
VFEDAPYEELKKYKRIVCAHTVMLSDSILKKLRRYVAEGGHLITIGDYGKYLPEGKKRRNMPFAQISCKLEEGKVTHLEDDQCYDKYHWYVLIHRFSSDLSKEFKDAPEYAVEKLRETGGEALLRAISHKIIVKVESKQDVFHSFYKVSDGYALHIVNVQNTIAKEGQVNHMLPIPDFIEGAICIQHEIKVSINMDIPAGKITLYSPERRMPVNIPYTKQADGSLSFVIPKDKFAGYALVEIK